MNTNSEKTVLLFSYGTLQQATVQMATFGRLLEGKPDVLLGYRLRPLQIIDSTVIATSGSAVHEIAYATGKQQHRVAGIVFKITPSELDAADKYEVDSYARVEVTLLSGTKAFVYVGN